MSTLVGIAFTEAALASLKAVEPKKVRQQIVNKINGLVQDAKPPGCCKVQGMTDGAEEVYRIRSGDYRALYVIRGDLEIVVLDIGHRKDVYRNR